MSYRQVPSLGFPGERRPASYLLEIYADGLTQPIQIYSWSGDEEGYNLFMPGRQPAAFQAHQMLAMVCCIHDYLNTHGGNNEA